jgi:hypothetical protein
VAQSDLNAHFRFRNAIFEPFYVPSERDRNSISPLFDKSFEFLDVLLVECHVVVANLCKPGSSTEPRRGLSPLLTVNPASEVTAV